MAVTRWRRDAFLVLLGAAALASAQAPKPAVLTAEQILEKSIAATGGRKAIEAVTSTVAKGEVEILPDHAHALIEYYAKAPAKRLIVTTFEGLGQIRQGCDGAAAWTQDPDRGVRELAGAEKDAALRECLFHAAIKWRELYPKVELAGKEKVGEREAYKILMHPASGSPEIRYIDTGTFLILRQVSPRESSKRSFEIRADMSDYRDVGGIKMPFQIHQTMPGYELLIKLLVVENNVSLEDARFGRPGAP